MFLFNYLALFEGGSGGAATVFRGCCDGIPGVLRRYSGGAATVFQGGLDLGAAYVLRRYQVRGLWGLVTFFAKCRSCDPLPRFST